MLYAKLCAFNDYKVVSMKKQESVDYNKQVKILTKNFRFLEPHYIRLLFEFCQFQASRTYKILEVLKDHQIPAAFIKKLVDFPNDSDDLIKGLQNQFNKKYGYVSIDLFNTSAPLEQNQNQKQFKFETLNFDFFEFVPRDICATIITYLDPYSFSKLIQTSNKFAQLSRNQALQIYYKNVCIKLFKNEQPCLPHTCRFSQIRHYVQSHPQQYGPNITNAVTNNLRYYVWKCEPKSFKIDNTFYKSFGSYRNLFLQAPRIHLNGFYVCRHKYVKIGEKGFTHSVTPMHVIFYYRYVRFFEDGSLLCYVSSTKTSKQKLSKLLSLQNLNNFDQNSQQLKIGQYMQYKNTLYMKIVKCNTIFSYQMQINSNDNKINDQLMVLSYNLEMVDQRQIIQNLYTYKPYRQKIQFYYLRNQLMEEENSNLTKSISL